MARIGIDATLIVPDGKGISRFLWAFLTELSRRKTYHHFIVFINTSARQLNLPNASHIEYIPVSIKNSLIWDLVQLPWHLEKCKIRLFQGISDRLPLLYRGIILPYIFEIPRHRNNIVWSRASTYAKLSMKTTEWLFPISLNRANYIVTSSNATRNALMRELQFLGTKIQVVFPGRDEAFTPSNDLNSKTLLCKRLGIPDGYILHFSSTNDLRDNTVIALRAFHASLQKIAHKRKLVIVGRTDPEKQGFLTLGHDLGIADQVIWTGYITDNELIDIYRGADLYLDPSRYEGFGYQVLEAMSCGVPIVCSNVTSLPEVVENAAIIADPDDIEAMASGIAAILSDASLADTLRTKGMNRAEVFSWQDSMTQMFEVYEKLLCE